MGITGLYVSPQDPAGTYKKREEEREGAENEATAVVAMVAACPSSQLPCPGARYPCAYRAAPPPCAINPTP